MKITCILIYNLIGKLKSYEYLKYILTEMPKHMDGTDFSFLDDLLPWA